MNVNHSQTVASTKRKKYGFLYFWIVKNLSILLWPFAAIYGSIAALRNYLYDKGWKKAYAVGVPVICVGNISAGGTGKTPVSEYLVDACLKQGHRTAYLSRGYGRKTRGYLRVPAQGASCEQFGDEASQVAAKFPSALVAVCEDRVAGAQRLIEEGAQVIILDDAYQHRRIHRDLNLLVVDAHIPPSKDYMLPMGRLREPRTGIRRAQAVIVNKVETESQIAKLRKELGQLPIAFTRFRPAGLRNFAALEKPEIALNGAILVAFSGIGRNAQFRRTLELAGGKVADFHGFADHHPFTQAEIAKILEEVAALREKSGNFTPGFAVTTEKDYFRLAGMPWFPQIAPSSLYYLPIELEWLEGEKDILHLLTETLKNYDARNR